MATVPERIGRYQILSRIGEGGMGALYLARDPAIGRLVAIKLLRDGGDNAELRERFIREARAAGGLGHVNIVTIFDIGEHEGQPFIAMEYIPGETLAEIIRRRTPLTTVRKIELIEELCAGLSHAHKGGIVHRDVKPANLIVDPEGVLKILDFGIARLSGGGGTQAGTVLGTLNYMSPEQITGRPVDHRSDIFSVGAVCYELLTYRRAFPGTMLRDVLAKIQTQQPETIDPSLVPSDLPPVVERALEKDREKRYQDLTAMRRDLTRIRLRLEAAEFAREEAEQAVRSAPTIAVDLVSAQVEDLLETGRRSLAQSDFGAAEAAAREALALDAGSLPARELEAEAARGAQQHKVAAWLREAEDAVGRGDIAAASRLLGLIEDVAGVSPKVAFLRQAVERLRDESETLRRRTEAARRHLEEARQALNAGTPAAALQAVDAALQAQPGHADAVALRQRIVAAIEARQAQEAVDRQAKQAVEEARYLADLGHLDQAEQCLTGFGTPHPMVTEALAGVRARRAELERLAREAQERAQAAERLQREIEACAAGAAQAVAAGDLISAQRAIEWIEGNAPHDSRGAALRASLNEAQRALSAAEAAASARRAIDEHLSRAVPAMEAHRWDQARTLIEAALAIDPRDPDALAWQSRLVEAVRREDEERRAVAQQTAMHVRDAQTAVEAGDLAAATVCLDRADGVQPGTPEVAALRREVQDRRAAAERLALDVTARLDRATQLISAGKHQKAAQQVAEALHLQPGNLDAIALQENIADTIAELERQRLEREEAEARAREEKREAEARAKAVKELLRSARRERRPAPALDLVRQALELVPDHEEALALAAQYGRALYEEASRVESPAADVTLAQPAPSPIVAPPTDQAPAEPVASARPLPIKAIAVAGAAVVVTAAVLVGWLAFRGPASPSPAPNAGDPSASSGTGGVPVTPPPADGRVVPPSGPPVSVTIDVMPWARVRIVPLGTPDAAPLPREYMTPAALELAAGDYEVRLEHPGTSAPSVQRIRVEAGKPNAFRFAMPGFNPDGVVNTLLGPERK